MGIIRCTMIFSYFALNSLAPVSYVSAADQVSPQTYPGSWWYGMHWPAFWWIFPLMFFVMMLVIFILMMRKGGMSCMWRDRMMCGPGFRDAMNGSSGEPSESAMEILNKRYAKGEIDRKEYEEKKAAISAIQGN